MNWYDSNRTDFRSRVLADGHYSRRKSSIGNKRFVGPGKDCCLVITNIAYWVSLWQKPEYVKHSHKQSWLCSAFRNTGNILSSILIREAISVTRFKFGKVPSDGMITFIDSDKVKKKRDPIVF